MKLIPIILILSVAIVFPGLIAKVKAKVAGRRMPNIFQPLFDVVRLFKKNTIYSPTTGLIFRIAPIIYFSSVFTCLLIIPFGGREGFISFDGDLVFFAYLLALGKFFMIIAAMDTGSGFEGMGANREALYSMLVEPAFFILMGAIALLSDQTSFHQMYINLQIDTNLSYIIGFAAVYILVFIAMTENSRLPVDDPKTHLELTMVHEVMVLDNSGFDLGLIHIVSWIKFAIYGTLISNVFVVFDWPFTLQILLFLIIQGLFASSVGLLESFNARNKMGKNPQWIIMLSAIAIITFLATLIASQKIILN